MQGATIISWKLMKLGKLVELGDTTKCGKFQFDCTIGFGST
jgi:hypothetical protein